MTDTTAPMTVGELAEVLRVSTNNLALAKDALENAKGTLSQRITEHREALKAFNEGVAAMRPKRASPKKKAPAPVVAAPGEG